MRSFNRECLGLFARLERSLRAYGSSFHWNRFDCRCAYWLADRAEQAREYFSQAHSEEVLRG